jgi:hypothetical protein
VTVQRFKHGSSNGTLHRSHRIDLEDLPGSPAIREWLTITSTEFARGGAREFSRG